MLAFGSSEGAERSHIGYCDESPALQVYQSGSL